MKNNITAFIEELQTKITIPFLQFEINNEAYYTYMIHFCSGTMVLLNQNRGFRCFLVNTITVKSILTVSICPVGGQLKIVWQNTSMDHTLFWNLVIFGTQFYFHSHECTTHRLASRIVPLPLWGCGVWHSSERGPLLSLLWDMQWPLSCKYSGPAQA